jgi:hypothetical protein
VIALLSGHCSGSDGRALSSENAEAPLLTAALAAVEKFARPAYRISRCADSRSLPRTRNTISDNEADIAFLKNG